ncbi:MAG: hypothetical protein ACI8RZ_003355 [Myxococcota bacterium]|jgi:hypothetical protein
MLPLLLLTTASAQDTAIHPALQAARGRKVWMVGAPPEDCRRVEQELGMLVDCDTDWQTAEDEVVIWCTEIAHEVGPALLEFLGRSHARVRTHQTNPTAAGTGECGMLFEITVRYPNTGSGGVIGGVVSGSPPTTGGKKLFGENGDFAGGTPPATVTSGSYGATLTALRGRRIWMVNAPESECARVEQELGLDVECDPTWESLAQHEIVIWCTQIPHEAAPAILEFLGKSDYEVRTHQTNPSAAGTSECGELYEITVRY